MGKFVGQNNDVNGKGPGYYFGEAFPLPTYGSETQEYYEPDVFRRELFFDAFSQVFFSTSICVGVLYAYGSYNHIKKPVIADALSICILDFIFALLAGFIAWSAIGVLQVKRNENYIQNSSVGLTFIAIPVMTEYMGDDGGNWACFFFVFLFFSGIDSAFSYI